MNNSRRKSKSFLTPPQMPFDMSAPATHPKRETSFLTVDPLGKRAPSAYHVDWMGKTQRARQQHKGGAALTQSKLAVHAFTPDKASRNVIHSLVKRSIQQGKDAKFALRMEIMDGLASPVPHFNDAHEEAFSGGIRKGNPHKSGGLVQFTQQGSSLANFDTVASNTQIVQQQEKIKKARKKIGDTTPTIIPPPITDTTSSTPSFATQMFSFNALQDQRAWARKLMAPIKEEDQ